MEEMSQSLCFDHYYTYAELYDALTVLTKTYPHLCTMASIGKSWEGRDVWSVTLTNQATGSADEKPAIYIDGNTHAGEVTGSMTALYTVNYLLEHYGKQVKITHLLDHYTFYVIPRVNPDGAELYLTTPYMLRSSVRPWPDTLVSTLPGLHQEDVDGNGYILLMRVRDDQRGEWKISQKDARLMVPRLMDDFAGAYYHLYPEGYIKEYQGEPFEVRPVPWGLDLNRNYPSEWNPNIRGGGDYATSEPEIKNVVDFILKHKNIGALEALHTSGGILFRSPYTYPESEMDQEDLQLLRTLGQRGYDLTGYPDVPSTGGIFAATIVDWAYEHCAIPGFTPELWDMNGRAGIKMDWHRQRRLSPTEKEARELKLLQWNDRELAGTGYFNWTSYQHPQLGQVEIGGWNPKFVRQNPPHKFLEQECHKMSQFLLAHALALPRVVIEEIEVMKQQEALFKITVRVGNHGFLPTNLCNNGKKNQIIAEDQMSIELPDTAELISGKATIKMGYLDGYYQGQKRQGQPARSCQRFDFLVKAVENTSIYLVIKSQKGGTIRQIVNLTN